MNRLSLKRPHKALTPPSEALARLWRGDRARLRSPWLLVGVLGIGIFVAGFDQTFIVTILPDILTDLRVPVDRLGDASWIVSGYLLGYTIALPVMGRIADVYGRVRIYIVALLLFILGSVLVAVSPSLTWLVLARGFQAIGGGAVVPIAMAITADILPLKQRPLALGILSALDDTSSLLGPLWGAALVGAIGWTGLFWLNLPLALPLLVIVPALAHPAASSPRLPVNWTGAGLLAGTLGLLAIALTDNGSDPRPLWQSLLLGGGALALGLTLVRHELRAGAPIIDVRLFRNLRYLAANFTYFVTGAGLITAMVTVPLLTNVLWEQSPLQGGLNLMRMMLFMPVGGMLGGFFAVYLGYRPTAILGLLCAAAGFFWMRLWPLTPSEPALWGALALAGLGFTLVDAPVMATVLDTVAERQRAAAAALLQVLQTTGMIVGMALLSTQGLGRFSHEAGRLFAEKGLEVTQQEYQVVMHRTFDETFLVAGLVVLSALVGVFLLDPGRAQRWRWSRFFGS